MSSLTQNESFPLEDALAKQIPKKEIIYWVAVLEKKNAALAKDIDSLATRLQSSEEKNTSLANDIRSFATRLCAFKEKNTVLEKKNAALAKDIDSLATRLQSSEEKNNIAEKNIEYLLHRVADLEDSTLEKFESLDHTATVQASIDMFQGTIAALKEKNAVLEERNRDLGKRFSNYLDEGFQSALSSAAVCTARREELAARIQKLEEK
jgi:chromosome segregation ATPase